MKWPIESLSHILETAEEFVDGDWVESKDQDPNGDVRLLQLADVGDGIYLNKSARYLTDAKARQLKCTFLKPGDILVARMPEPLGRACIFPGDSKPSVTVVDVCIVRPDTSKLDSRWLTHCFNAPITRSQVRNLAVGTTRTRISRSNLGSIRIPLPPLSEQRRIAEVLDRADALRAKRRAALAQLDTLTQAIFLDMFGDPVANPNGWPAKSLPEICHCYSGGTPTKSNRDYWEGSTPWFSPKDLKQDDLFDSQDHISAEVHQSGRLKLLPSNTVAIVVRGMILAHTFPISVLRVPATINQDLKALCPHDPIDAQFLAFCLRAQSKFVLQHVSEAGHGTKRLDADGLAKIRIPCVPLVVQKEFSDRVAAIESLKKAHLSSMNGMDVLFASLQHRAFRGEL